MLSYTIYIYIYIYMWAMILVSPGTPKGRTETCQCRTEREREREREREYIYIYIIKIHPLLNSISWCDLVWQPNMSEPMAFMTTLVLKLGATRGRDPAVLPWTTGSRRKHGGSTSRDVVDGWNPGNLTSVDRLHMVDNVACECITSYCL